MKQQLAWFAPVAVALVAAIGLSSPSGGRSSDAKASQGEVRSSVERTAEKSVGHGSCVEIQKQIQTFLGTDDPITAPDSCHDRSEAKSAQLTEAHNRARDLTFVIATIPDPTHSHFALEFDRMTDAIQEGASDEAYVYDSSWLPWETGDAEYARVSDQDIADDRQDAREEQPGVLLFRQRLKTDDKGGRLEAEQSYKRGLVVFLVGEEPTRGIHVDQFRNATAWIAALQPTPDVKFKVPSRILGPSFSGSVPALARLLAEEETAEATARDLPVKIYSGNITGNRAMALFSASAGTSETTQFASFQNSDDYLMNRYCEYLTTSKFNLARLAIISEDQTAYGSEVVRQGEAENSKPDEDLRSCNLGIERLPAKQPARLFYPRDISALRTAYQREGIFNAQSASQADAGQHELTSDLADPRGKQHDTVREYSGDQNSLSQEAVLQQIVSELRVHASEYILLRSSNVLDQIFLSHYLKLAYPQGRIVILGADQLLRRESGSARLAGIMTLTTYPLVPWEPHWTNRSGDPNAHSHRVFPQDRAEGVYMATRALLHFPVSIHVGEPCRNVLTQLFSARYRVADSRSELDPDVAFDEHAANVCKGMPAGEGLTLTRAARRSTRGLVEASGKTRLKLEFATGTNEQRVLTEIEREGKAVNEFAIESPEFSGFASTDTQFEVPDYGSPFWIVKPSGDHLELPAWLSVLGRSDFWPLAALDSAVLREPSLKDKPVAAGKSVGLWHEFARATTALVQVATPWRARKYGDCLRLDPGWSAMPLSMRVAVTAFVMLMLFHACCCWFPSITQKPRHRSYFVCVGNDRRPFKSLMVMASVTLSSMATVFAWAYGGMSPDGEPLEHPILWLLFLPFCWLLSGTALLVNLRKQRYYPRLVSGPDDVALPEEWFASLRVVGCYVACTLLAYYALYYSTERVLVVANRFPTYWRSINLTSGVSPIVPLLAMGVGVYLWFWYSLQGLAVMGQDRPCLPSLRSLEIRTAESAMMPAGKVNWLRMFSRRGAGRPVEHLCSPFAPRVLKTGVVVWISLGVLTFFISDEIPLRSLGARSFSLLICCLLGLLISAMVAIAWQLLHVWMGLRELLTYLDRLPLRRSMAAFPGVSWKSVWNISGNVFDMRYKLVTSELYCLTHLENSLPAPPVQVIGRASERTAFSRMVQTLTQNRESATKTDDKNVDVCRKLFERLNRSRSELSEWYSTSYSNREDRDQRPLRRMQRELANFAGVVMVQLLLPAWRCEKGHTEPDKSADNGAAKSSSTCPPDEPYIRHAEQLVCFVYLGFIQNVMGRMRSMVMSMLWLYIAVTVALSTYPFDPRPAIGGAMLLLFAVLSASVIFVYAQMHRDPILSLVTDTKPGELGGDFWLKLAGFGFGPVLGLLTTLFPQITDFVFSWVQPGLASIK